MVATKFEFEIYGLISCEKYAKVKYIALDLMNNFDAKVKIKDFFEFQWSQFVEKTKLTLCGEVWGFRGTALCFCNGKYVGNETDFENFVNENFDFDDFRNQELYKALAINDYKKMLEKTNNEFVYFDIEIDEQKAGKIVIELFVHKVPKTCKNFKHICQGEEEISVNDFKITYVGTIIHRVVKNGWIQGGDFWFQRGDGGESIFGTTFEDENFTVKHEERGIVGMCNKGRHSNGSQFYITLQPCPWLDKRFVAFGQVIEGSEVLKMIEDLELENQRPLDQVKISDCGVYTVKY